MRLLPPQGEGFAELIEVRFRFDRIPPRALKVRRGKANGRGDWKSSGLLWIREDTLIIKSVAGRPWVELVWDLAPGEPRLSSARTIEAIDEGKADFHEAGLTSDPSGLEAAEGIDFDPDPDYPFSRAFMNWEGGAVDREVIEDHASDFAAAVVERLNLAVDEGDGKEFFLAFDRSSRWLQLDTESRDRGLDFSRREIYLRELSSQLQLKMKLDYITLDNVKKLETRLRTRIEQRAWEGKSRGLRDGGLVIGSHDPAELRIDTTSETPRDGWVSGTTIAAVSDLMLRFFGQVRRSSGIGLYRDRGRNTDLGPDRLFASRSLWKAVIDFSASTHWEEQALSSDNGVDNAMPDSAWYFMFGEFAMLASGSEAMASILPDGAPEIWGALLPVWVASAEVFVNVHNPRANPDRLDWDSYASLYLRRPGSDWSENDRDSLVRKYEGMDRKQLESAWSQLLFVALRDMNDPEEADA